MTYSEIQTALKEFRTLGYELTIKLNSNKAILQAEHDRLVAEKEQQETLMDANAAFDEVEPTAEDTENFIQLTAQADYLAEVASAADDEMAETEVPFMLAPVPAFEGIQTEEEKYFSLVEKLSQHCYSAPMPETTPGPVPTLSHHGTAGLTLLVLFLQALQLLLTVAIPLVIQVYTIGRKTFGAVALAIQSEPVLRLIDAS